MSTEHFESEAVFLSLDVGDEDDFVQVQLEQEPESDQKILRDDASTTQLEKDQNSSYTHTAPFAVASILFSSWVAMIAACFLLKSIFPGAPQDAFDFSRAKSSSNASQPLPPPQVTKYRNASSEGIGHHEPFDLGLSGARSGIFVSGSVGQNRLDMKHACHYSEDRTDCFVNQTDCGLVVTFTESLSDEKLLGYMTEASNRGCESREGPRFIKRSKADGTPVFFRSPAFLANSRKGTVQNQRSGSQLAEKMRALAYLQDGLDRTTRVDGGPRAQKHTLMRAAVSGHKQKQTTSGSPRRYRKESDTLVSIASSHNAAMPAETMDAQDELLDIPRPRKPEIPVVASINLLKSQ